MVEPDVAPAGGDGRTPASGRPRDPLGGIKTPREELAGWGGTKGFRSAEASLAQKGAPRRPAGPVQTLENADPRTETATDGAPRGARILHKGMRHDG